MSIGLGGSLPRSQEKGGGIFSVEIQSSRAFGVTDGVGEETRSKHFNRVRRLLQINGLWRHWPALQKQIVSPTRALSFPEVALGEQRTPHLPHLQSVEGAEGDKNGLAQTPEPGTGS